LYQIYPQTQLTKSELLILDILINLLQIVKILWLDLCLKIFLIM